MSEKGRPSAESDRDLLQACKDGSPAAWEKLVRKYRHLVYSVALRSRLDPETAADVFQTVFLNLIRSIDDLRQQDTLVPWLVTATKRESWRASRKSRRSSEDEDALETLPVAATAQEELEALERQVQVRVALDRIDERCRRLLEALFYSDPPPSYAEIAKDLRIPVPSIGPTRIRCLDKLRRVLGKEAFPERGITRPPRGSIAQ